MKLTLEEKAELFCAIECRRDHLSSLLAAVSGNPDRVRSVRRSLIVLDRLKRDIKEV